MEQYNDSFRYLKFIADDSSGKCEFLGCEFFRLLGVAGSSPLHSRQADLI